MSEWTENDLVRLLSMVISGQLTVQEISKQLGKSTEAVRKQMRAKNLRVVNRAIESRYEILNDYKQKIPLLDIADKHNTNIKDLKNVLMWGHENKLVDARKAIDNRWKEGDILKITRMYMLLDDKDIYKTFGKVFNIEPLLKTYWGIKPDLLCGLEVTDFIELYNVREDDSFPLIITSKEVSPKNFLKVVPWVFIEDYEPKSQDIEFATQKMATLQKMLYLENDKNKILEKIMSIIDNKYQDKDYSLMQ